LETAELQETAHPQLELELSAEILPFQVQEFLQLHQQAAVVVQTLVQQLVEQAVRAVAELLLRHLQILALALPIKVITAELVWFIVHRFMVQAAAVVELVKLVRQQQRQEQP
jgi:hypothetical protein